MLTAAWLGASLLFTACSGQKEPNPPPKAGNQTTTPLPNGEKPAPPVALSVDKNQTPPPDSAVTPVDKTASNGDAAKGPFSKGNPLRAVDDPPPAGIAVTEAPAQPVPPAAPAKDGLYRDWPAPQVALVLSGEQEGYLEPCGCAGFENMKGGLTRRHECVKELLAKGWPVVGLDAGGQLNLRRHGKEAELQFQTTVDSLKAMGYQAIGFGTSDLLLPPEMLLSATAAVKNPKDPSKLDTPFVSANVGIFGFDDNRLPTYRVIEAGGLKIGVTTVLGEKEQAEVKKIRGNNQGEIEGIEFLSPTDALKKVLPKLQEKKCDRLILLVYASAADASDLAKAFPEFQIVVSADSANGAEPPAEAGAVSGTNVPLIEVGHKGSHVVVVGLYDDAKTPIRYQRVPMDNRFKESPEMIVLKAEMQSQLKILGWEGLELKPQPQPTGRKFAGSDECATCHTQADAVFQKTPHAHAFATLEKLNPPRIHDPECVSCHVTGWNFQGFYPYESGFGSHEKTPKLENNGCENCHGPGKEHADAETNGNAPPAKLNALRAQLRLPMERDKNKENCAQCHDGENSPKFDKEFDAYWEKIFHKGKN